MVKSRIIYVVIGALLLCGGMIFKTTSRSAIPQTEVEQIVDVPGLPRVLIIGDSISIGYTPYVRAALAGKANVHHTQQNAKSTTFGLRYLDYWLGDKPWDVIVFNFGLHDLNQKQTPSGWSGSAQTTTEEYRANMETIVSRLKNAKARLLFVSTTTVPDGAEGRERDGEIKLNRIAFDIMNREGVGIIRQSVTPLSRDVHFSEQGYRELAAKIAQCVMRALLPQDPYRFPSRSM